jgi:branched-chain amino acid aminotransferase
VAGVMRKKVMQLAKKSNLPVIETSISPNVLEGAEEVFLTNAVSGIKWVSGFKKKRYFHRLAEKFVKSLNDISN